MGTCLSKKSVSSTSPTPATLPPPPPPPDLTSKPKLVQEEEKKIPQPEESVKKEIFIIKQRKSHERRPAAEQNLPISPPVKADEVESSSPSSPVTAVTNGNSTSSTTNITAAPVRTSSCTKEEVDAILIQCGRLSRSSSGKASGDRKYSGSKRSYDFDHETDGSNNNGNNNDFDYENYPQNRNSGRLHHSRSSHRRTPSREKDGAQEQKRSGSREREERRNRSGGGGSRRVSRSPGRRSDTPSAPSATPNAAPGKMVAVPARDKNSTAESTTTTTGIKRVSVKRCGDVGGVRTSASPRSQSPANATRATNENPRSQSPANPTRATNENHRSQSPANARAANENTHPPQQASLSRNSSRKAEHSRSPYRRNPMADVDDNCLRSQDQINKSTGGINNKMQRTKDTDNERAKKPLTLQSQKKPDERNNKTSTRENQQEQIVDEPIQVKGLPSSEVVMTAAVENPKPQSIARSRSSRMSRDLDINLGINPDTLLNPSSYASLLLEDIQNFHQQSTPAFSLPPCVTKACSILDAVADLNSSTSPNITSVLSESEGDRSKNNDKSNNNVSSSAHVGKMRSDVKDPIVESAVFVKDDILEPSLHKYITVRRRGEELEEQESSGSNSFIGQHLVPSSSTWEPNSADSTDRWTSRSNTREELDEVELGARKVRNGGSSSHMLPSVTLSGKRRDMDHHQVHTSSIPIPAAAASM